MEHKANRLSLEKSPYLLQHAMNPVDWFPWGEEAFEKARSDEKPVFLSIGYSTCHWCHVMESESFEDPETAGLLNRVFVCIKVDREERPDIDGIYMTVCQMMTGSGGWPLTIFLTPDKDPFFAGTYFPREGRHGRPGVKELALRVEDLWSRSRSEVMETGHQMTAALREAFAFQPGSELGPDVLESAHRDFTGRFDEEYGGFGSSMKFPTPHSLFFLLRYWKRTGGDFTLRMVEKTLEAMRSGGIYDHIGFGFHRYSTDRFWLVPHFEKMLYDQALLAMAYTEGWQAARNTEYEKTAREVFTYVLRDMTSPEGGFYSAEDADSEGEEGKFYLWTEEEIRKVLNAEEAQAIIKVFCVDPLGNFTDPHTGGRNGLNILRRMKPPGETASSLGVSQAKLEERLEEARRKLFDARSRRAHPHKDDKILTDWNGLMIASLAKGARAFDHPPYLEAAREAMEFVRTHLKTPGGRLLHRYRDGQAAVPGNLDDYAFLIWGALELYETSFEAGFLKDALELTHDMIEQFWDARSGGFYFTADDADPLPVRSKDIVDGAVPSGNSVAALNLLRLGRIAAAGDLEEKAAAIGKAFSRRIEESPSGYSFFMSALDFALGPSCEVVVAGRTDAEETKAMLRALGEQFAPGMVVIVRPVESHSPDIVAFARYTETMEEIDGKPAAFVCRNYRCELPTTDIGKMLELISARSERSKQ
jgi:hypothetical protein